MCGSLLVLMQLSPLCLGKVVFISSSPLLTAQWHYSALPLCFCWRLSVLGASWIYGWVSLSVGAVMPRAWWQQVPSGTDIAVALLLAPEPLSSPGLPSSAHSATPGSAGTEAGFVSASPPWCAQETGATLSCVSLPAVAHRALLTRLVPHTGQQEAIPVLLQSFIIWNAWSVCLALHLGQLSIFSCRCRPAGCHCSMFVIL